MAAARADDLAPLFTAFPALVGREPTSEERDRFERYAALLLLWNRTHHLTALRTRADIARRLFLDSLLFRAALPAGPLRLADIGAGAGIPGVPLRIVDPGLDVVLIESQRKPVSFLRALLREINLPEVRIHHGRAEEVGRQDIDLFSVFDVVVARAVGAVERVLPAAMPLLKPGGLCVVSGPPAKRGGALPAVPGGARWRTLEYKGLGVTRIFLLAIREA